MGGAVMVGTFASAALTSTSFVSNGDNAGLVGSTGGGLQVMTQGQATLHACTFTGNLATGEGGGWEGPWGASACVYALRPDGGRL
jgi:hypothetical protein